MYVILLLITIWEMMKHLILIINDKYDFKYNFIEIAYALGGGDCLDLNQYCMTIWYFLIWMCIKQASQ